MRRNSGKFTFRTSMLRAAIGSLTIIILSILAIWWSTANEGEQLAKWLNVVGVTGLTVGLVQIVMDVLVRQSMADEIIQALGIRDRVNSVGISNIESGERFDWQTILADAREIHAYAQDSHSFTKQIWPHILRRAGDKSITIHLHYPADSPTGTLLRETIEKDWKARSPRLHKGSQISVREVQIPGNYSYLRTLEHLAIILEPVADGIGFPSQIVQIYRISGNEEAITLFGDPIQDFEAAVAKSAGPVFENIVGQVAKGLEPVDAIEPQEPETNLQQLNVPLDKKE